MPKYRKKPVVIEAVQISRPMTVETLEGVMSGSPGDWLVTGVEGEQYFCKDAIFRKTYARDTGEEMGGELDKALEELEAIGWPCRLAELPRKYDKLSRDYAEVRESHELRGQQITQLKRLLRERGINWQKRFSLENVKDSDS